MAWRALARIKSRTLRLAGRAVASITFDDVPESAASIGAPLLEGYGVRGTFYVAAGTCGMRDQHWDVANVEQIRNLATSGHEIGCHTARHVNVQSLSRHELSQECDRNAQLLADLCGVATPTNFAYPFGDLGLRQKRQLQERFSSCRSIYEHLNVDCVDLGRVGAIGLFDATMDRSRLELLVREAVAKNAWLVFYTHDVAQNPTFMGSSPRLLAETLRILAEHDVACLTMNDALLHFRNRKHQQP